MRGFEILRSQFGTLSKKTLMENAEKIAKEFIDKVFEKGEPRNNMCFVTCLPLSILLTRNGVKNSLKWLDYKVNESSFPIGHCHIFLENEKKILDPTISQFFKNETKIIFEENEFESNFKKTDCVFKTWFNIHIDTLSSADMYEEGLSQKVIEGRKNVRDKFLYIFPILEEEISKLNFDESKLNETEQWIKCRYDKVVSKLKEDNS